MKTIYKELIVSELKALALKTSQNKIAKRADVSTATISQMINSNWDFIRDEMWQKVKLNLNIQWHWVTAETTNLKSLTGLLKSVQGRSISICIAHDAGAGKTHAYREYSKENDNVIHLECKNYWTKKIYVKELLRACGLDDFGTVETLINRFTNHIKELSNPLVIIDQIDKLKDPSLDLFMDFYNDLDGHCGFVLSGVPALKKRIERGCGTDRIGYKELRSRIGRKYITLKTITEQDVSAICIANGVTNEQVINEIYNTCEGDLRRVKRSVDQYYLLNNESTKSA